MQFTGMLDSEFTFQCGSIKSEYADVLHFYLSIFTFQCGSIKSGELANTTRCFKHIYIPMWFY